MDHLLSMEIKIKQIDYYIVLFSFQGLFKYNL